MSDNNICIITFPVTQSGVVPLSNLANIINKLSDKVFIISSNVFYKEFKHNNNVKIYPVEHKTSKNTICRITNYILTQLKITRHLLSNKKLIDTCIFFIGGEGLVIPIIVSKVFKKKTILYLAGSIIETAKQKNDPLTRCLIIASHICRYLSDAILIYSSRFTDKWELNKYKNKVRVIHRHFIDFNVFKVRIDFNKKESLIGYVGRFSEEKGIINLIKAIKLIYKQNKDIKYILIGDGNLQNKIQNYIENSDLRSYVTIISWIPHDRLPEYLNKLKFLVLPSYTEGLPNIMLEAMACGTPVLATSVGAIPDVIKDGETGFLLNDNSPECIAESVLKILNMPNGKLEQVSNNASKLIKQEFTYENIIERWGKILEDI